MVSKLADLIEEMCPDGVKYCRLGDMATLERGTSITKKDVVPGDVPVVAGGRKPAYFHNTGNRDGKTIVIAGSGAYAGYVSWWEQPIFVSDAFSIKTDDRELGMRYCFHWLDSIQDVLHRSKRGGGVPHVYPRDVAKLKIPVPPLEVQEEIVRILDAFVNLEHSLCAELELRKTQAEEYRDKMFGQLGPAGVSCHPLGEVGSFIRGGGPQKKDFLDTGFPCIHYGQIYTRYGLSTQSTLVYVSEEIFNKSRKAQPGNVIIAVTSENDEDLGNALAWLGSQPVAVSNHTLIYESEMDPMFLSYFFRSEIFESQKRKITTGTKVRSLSQAGMSRVLVPIPPLEVQQDIAAKLDTFQALIQSMEQEIDLRRRQYTYYREELLTFTKKES